TEGGSQLAEGAGREGWDDGSGADSRGCRAVEEAAGVVRTAGVPTGRRRPGRAQRRRGAAGRPSRQPPRGAGRAAAGDLRRGHRAAGEPVAQAGPCVDRRNARRANVSLPLNGPQSATCVGRNRKLRAGERTGVCSPFGELMEEATKGVKKKAKRTPRPA